MLLIINKSHLLAYFQTMMVSSTASRFVLVLAAAFSALSSAHSGEDHSENNFKMHWAAHGILASIAWAILIPLGIGSVMLRKELVKLGFSEGFWFQLHYSFNLLALILTITSCAIAVYIINEEGSGMRLKEDPHFRVGTVIFLAAFLQAMFALLRPSLPRQEEKKESGTNRMDACCWGDEEDADTESKDIAAAGETGEGISKDKDSSKGIAAVGEKKSLLRLAWEANHRLFGVGLLATAWWQIHSGWELYETGIGGEDLGTVFLGVAGGISGIIVIVYVVQKMRPRA
jgi:hypothetical protein